MKTLSFVDLCFDVKKLIIGFIDRPTDLKSLCLTSRKLRDLAVPHLYRRVQLFLGEPQDLLVNNLLSGNNPGLRYIRAIDIHQDEIPLPPMLELWRRTLLDYHPELKKTRESIIARAQSTIGSILERLPENMLEYFAWWPYESFSVDNFLLLCKKQKSLKILHMMATDRLLSPELESIPDIFKDMPNLRSLRMYPDTVDKLQICRRVLCDNHMVEDLRILNGLKLSDVLDVVGDFSSSCFDDDSDDPDNDPSEGCLGLCPRTIFGEPKFYDERKALKLKRLGIEGIDLRPSPRTLLKAINLMTLTVLEIVDCPRAGSLFSQLSRFQGSLSLKVLKWKAIYEPSTLALKVFEGFLSSFHGLETIYVNLCRVEALPKTSAILNHQKTLVSLSVFCEVDARKVFTYTEDELREICQFCAQIKQLSLMFPEKQSISPEEPRLILESFDLPIDVLRLKHLATLNITSWPSIAELPYRNRDIVEGLLSQKLERITQNIFNASDNVAFKEGFGFGDRSKLSVIAWGRNGRSAYDNKSGLEINQLSFVRDLRVDAFGQRSLTAVRTPRQHIRFVEPESDILNDGVCSMLYDI